jgi:phosphoribosyl 1,2-cyclic phosphate phosphodiesterase
MEVLFLGTGAAEGIPAVYCRCPYCARVRERGGRDLRTRSALRIGERYQIDFNADTASQIQQEKLDLFALEHILITHTHDDHFQFEEIVKKSLALVKNENPLHVYLSVPAKLYFDSIVHVFTAQLEDEADEATFWACYPVHALQFFERYSIGELEVETVKGSHAAEGEKQYSLNYLIRLPDGRRLLYAVDTGYYLEETWKFLRGRHVEILIMDCTEAGRTQGEERPFAHHNGRSFLGTLERMRSIGFIDGDTRIFATHIQPHQGLFHEEIQRFFDQSPFAVTVAYDGLRI